MRIRTLALKLRLWLVLPALALLMVMVLAACSTARMALPDSLTVNTDEMPVTGRQGFNWGKDLTFGDYRLTNIRRGWVSGQSISLLFYRHSEAHRKYAFTLKSPYRSDAIDVTCMTNAKLDELDFGDSQWRLRIDLDSQSITISDFTIDDEVWSIVLASNDTTGHLTNGIISNGTREILIEPTRTIAGAAYDISSEVGYFFTENDEFIGAAENINDGAVFMLRSLDGFSRDLIAVASGVIFIYEDVLRRR